MATRKRLSAEDAGWQRLFNLPAPTGTSDATTKTYVDTADAAKVDKDSTAGASLRVPANATGGGIISVSSSYGVKWTSRFITISNAKGAQFATGGFFEMLPPPAGTVLTGINRVDVTVASDGFIPLAQWDALYYILPIGSNHVTNHSNWRVVYYSSSDYVIPDHWVQVAIRGESGQVRFINGVTLTAGRTWDTLGIYTAHDINGGSSYNAHRLGISAKNINDWNTANENGWYMAYGAANAPGPSQWFIGQVFRHNSMWLIQTVYPFTDAGLRNGTLSGWRRVGTDVSGALNWGNWYRTYEAGPELDARYAAKAHTHTGGVAKFSADCVATTNPQSFTHGLGSADLQVTVREVSTGKVVYADVTIDATTITADFGGAPTAGQYRITAVG